jgi:hypothetical protein
MAVLPIGLRGDGQSNARALVAMMRSTKKKAELYIDGNEVVIELGDIEGRGTTLQVALRRWGEAFLDGKEVDETSKLILDIETKVQMGS